MALFASGAKSSFSSALTIENKKRQNININIFFILSPSKNYAFINILFYLFI